MTTTSASERYELKSSGEKLDFAGSDNGGRFASILFSFTASCKHNRVDPYAYLADVLAPWPQNRAEPRDYLPDQWLSRHPEAQLELNRSA